MNFELARHNMIDGQLRPNKINNTQLLARFAATAREEFTPESARPHAYLDQPIPLSSTREMFSPLVTARLIQELALKPSDAILVLAGNTGYTTALLAGLVSKMTMVEDDAALLKSAKANLPENVTVISASPASHKPSQTFNAILVDATFAQLPNLAALTAALPEGGKLAGVRMSAEGLPEAVILTKHGKSLVEEVLFETKGTPHPAFAAEATFSF